MITVNQSFFTSSLGLKPDAWYFLKRFITTLNWHYFVFIEGEKGSVGEKGSHGEKGQKGMPGTCDKQVGK